MLRVSTCYTAKKYDTKKMNLEDIIKLKKNNIQVAFSNNKSCKLTSFWLIKPLNCDNLVKIEKKCCYYTI